MCDHLQLENNQCHDGFNFDKYSFYDTPEEESEFVKESQVATTEEQRKQALTRPKSPVKETIENNVKLAIAEIRAEKEKVKVKEEKVKEDEAASADSGEKVLSEKKEMKDRDKWKQYWKNEYTSTTQPNAADYN